MLLLFYGGDEIGGDDAEDCGAASFVFREMRLFFILLIIILLFL